jgi:hypothetical protein
MDKRSGQSHQLTGAVGDMDLRIFSLWQTRAMKTMWPGSCFDVTVSGRGTPGSFCCLFLAAERSVWSTSIECRSGPDTSSRLRRTLLASARRPTFLPSCSAWFHRPHCYHWLSACEQFKGPAKDLTAAVHKGIADAPPLEIASPTKVESPTTSPSSTPPLNSGLVLPSSIMGRSRGKPPFGVRSLSGEPASAARRSKCKQLNRAGC